MEIVCCTDDNYVMPTGVMLTSLFENNKEEDIRVHLLHSGIAEAHINAIKDVADAYNQSVSFYRMDDGEFGFSP